MTKRLVIMQAKPGSGKSFVAEALSSYTNTESRIVSADYYLWDDGEYKWTPERGADAHTMALSEARSLMSSGCPSVIIDNTNLKHNWVMPYLELAIKYEYAVQVIRVEADPELQVAQNNTRTGGRRVPLDQFKKIQPVDVMWIYMLRKSVPIQELASRVFQSFKFWERW